MTTLHWPAADIGCSCWHETGQVQRRSRQGARYLWCPTSAVSEDEHAVSMALLGPRRSSVQDSRLANMEPLQPVCS